MRPVKALALVTWVCAVTCGSWQTLRAAPAAMTRAEIDAAIAFGETHEPQPYWLRPNGSEDAPYAMGLVYTPFLRVAFEARAAARRGERLGLPDMTAAMRAPLAYIAFRWPHYDPIEHPELATVKPQVLMLPAPASSVAQAHRGTGYFRLLRIGVKPVWSADGSKALESFGAEPPFDDIAFVAAYPLDSLVALRTFVLFKALPADESVEGPLPGLFKYGVVRPADAARWR